MFSLGITILAILQVSSSVAVPTDDTDESTDINRLEEIVRRLESTVSHQQRAIYDQKYTSDQQLQTLTDLEKVVSDLTRDGGIQEKAVSNLERKVSKLEQANTRLHDENIKLHKLISDQGNSASMINASSVAFFAKRAEDFGPVSPATVITYPILDVNLGGGFDNTTGVFTAPFSGIYFFHYLHRHGEFLTEIGLYVNNIVWYQEVSTQELLDNDDNNFATTTGCVTLQLQQGNTVSIKLLFGQGYVTCQSGGQDCQFGGFLVYETV